MTQETIEVEQTTPKPWQKGFDIEEIERIKTSFSRYNEFTRSPFAQWNGPKIAQSLEKNRILKVPGGIIDTHIAKVSTKIVMYYDVEIGQKLKGDRIINALGVEDVEKLAESLKKLIENESAWLIILEEDEKQKEVATLSGFRKVGVKITTFSEIFGIYFKNKPNILTELRRHPQVDECESYCMTKLPVPDFTEVCQKIEKKISELDFSNHYSKYNKSSAWGAISLRGFSSDPGMIEKPSCMKQKWLDEHKDEDLRLQDTTLRASFPEIDEILAAFPTKSFDRIRFMRLEPGGGELQRHVDHVEKDAGLRDGQIMRFHVPIKTNPNVIFTMWDINGKEIEQNMKQGETWMFDFRKPHRAVNGGDDIRIHLVIDIPMDQAMRDFITQGSNVS